jgi:hypothetical protein
VISGLVVVQDVLRRCCPLTRKVVKEGGAGYGVISHGERKERERCGMSLISAVEFVDYGVEE